jgi:hypothetical protein
MTFVLFFLGGGNIIIIYKTLSVIQNKISNRIFYFSFFMQQINFTDNYYAFYNEPITNI